MSDAPIVLEDVAKWYGPVVGLAGFRARVEPGITALLGPNGAGKSTLYKCLAGLVRPDRGTVRVLGADPFANHELYRRIGICPELDPLPGDLRGTIWLERIARLAGFAGTEAQRRTLAALEAVGMREDGKKRLGGMSKGMRQRMKIAQAVVHDPELLLLDEPFGGLDPLQRRATLDLVRSYGARGRTVLVASHVLHEVEQLTDRVLLVREGRLLAEGTVREIRDHFENVPRRIRVHGPAPRELAGAALAHPATAGVRLLDGEEDAIEIATKRPDELLALFTAACARGELEIRELHTADEDLAAVFGMLEG